MSKQIKKPSKLLSNVLSQVKSASDNVNDSVKNILESLDDISECYSKLSNVQAPDTVFKPKLLIGNLLDSSKANVDTSYDDLQNLLTDLDTDLDDEFGILRFNLQALESIEESLESIRSQIALKSI